MLENSYLAYGKKDNSNNLSSYFKDIDKLHFNFLTSKIYPLLIENKNEKILDYYLNNALLVITSLMYNDRKLFKNNNFFKTYIYWILYHIYKIDNKIFNNYNIDQNLLLDFQYNNLKITLSDSILISEQNIKNYLSKYIQENYLYNDFMTTAASLILPYLD